MEDVSLDLKKNAPKSTRRTHGGRGKRGRRRFGAGRKKGVPNKLNADVMSAIMQAFNEVGGAEYLQGCALGPAHVLHAARTGRVPELSSKA